MNSIFQLPVREGAQPEIGKVPPQLQFSDKFFECCVITEYTPK